MTEPEQIAQRLREAASCPMWADHAEVSKSLLTRASDLIAHQAATIGEVTRERNDARHERAISELARDALVKEKS
jgi:hypothetical protein